MKREYYALGTLVLVLIIFDAIAFSLISPNVEDEQNSSLDAGENDPAVEQVGAVPLVQENTEEIEIEPLIEEEPEPECDSNNLNLCSENECNDIDKYWYENQCNSEEEQKTEVIKIASWNLGIFNETKSENETLSDFYVSLIEDYDIVFIQGIQDENEVAFSNLCDLLPDYSCKISDEAGRVDEREQQGVIYNPDKVDYDDKEEFYPDTDDRWEWPPIRVTFFIGNYELFIYSIHIEPNDVTEEIAFLEDLVKEEENEDGEDNIIVLGVLNADCDNYNRDEETDFNNWEWIIDDDTTTSSETDCAYDRIILNKNAFKSHTDEGIYSDVEEDKSKHYLIWIELEVPIN